MFSQPIRRICRETQPAADRKESKTYYKERARFFLRHTRDVKHSFSHSFWEPGH